MPKPHHPLVSKEWAEKLEPYFERLKPREEAIIRMRYGLSKEPNYLVEKEFTLQEIGHKFGISRERCRQIIYRSIFRLYSIYRKEAEA